MNSRVALVAALVLLCVPHTLANPMTENSQAMTVNFDYVDFDDVGKVTSFQLNWSTFVLEDSLELGLSVGYLEEDPELGSSMDANFLGPFIQYNISPESDINPYLSFGIRNIGGDLGDLYDYDFGYSIGINVFIGNSASLNIGLGKSTRVGSDNVSDLDSVGLSAGMSFYFGNK